MRRPVYLLAVLLLLGWPSVARAQHPCDSPAIANQVVNAAGPVSIAFCHSMKDALGDPTTITSFRLTIDSVDVFTGALTPIGAPSATGFNYYETPKTITVKRGLHAAVVYASNADAEGVGSDPFAFTVKAPPGKGKIQSVIK